MMFNRSDSDTGPEQHRLYAPMTIHSDLEEADMRVEESAAPLNNLTETIKQIKETITNLYDVVSKQPHAWQTCLESSRSAMATLDRDNYFHKPDRLAEQAWIIKGLQDYAYHDADTGCIYDIAEFCRVSWLRILQNHPDDEVVLAGKCASMYPAFNKVTYSLGLGHNWLQRACSIIARIDQKEGGGTSSESSSQGPDIEHLPSSPANDYLPVMSPLQHDARWDEPLYVEARGYLQPAVDFFSRAVRSADAHGGATGDLLVMVRVKTGSTRVVRVTRGSLPSRI
jgi:hypothetical protein